MIRTLVCISNYGASQLRHLEKVLAEYERMKRFQVEVLLQTTVPVEVGSLSIKVSQSFFDSAIGFDLAMQHRNAMIERQDEYDLFIYAENDILIKASNLAAFWEATSVLPSPYVVGFLRYEHYRGDPDDNAMYLPDAHPECGDVYDGELMISGIRCIKLVNRHQGCFVLTRSQLKTAIKSPHFNFYFPKDPLNREVGATFVYIGCGLQRVIPWDCIDRLMIHHLADKYVNSNEPPWNRTRPHSLASLKRLVTVNAKSHSAEPSESGASK